MNQPKKYHVCSNIIITDLRGQQSPNGAQATKNGLDGAYSALRNLCRGRFSRICTPVFYAVALTKGNERRWVTTEAGGGGHYVSGGGGEGRQRRRSRRARFLIQLLSLLQKGSVPGEL